MNKQGSKKERSTQGWYIDAIRWFMSSFNALMVFIISFASFDQSPYSRKINEFVLEWGLFYLIFAGLVYAGFSAWVLVFIPLFFALNVFRRILLKRGFIF